MDSTFSSLKEKKGRAIFFRGGALGDFILTIPLVSFLGKIYEEVVLLSSPAYFSLIEKDYPFLVCKDLDYGLNQITDLLPGSDLFSFWEDPDWSTEMQNRGSKEIHILPPRPQDNRHFLDSVFHTCSFSPLSPELFSVPCLGDQWNNSTKLWIHPGSGSVKKNMPFSFFLKISVDWLEKNPANQVVFSFGEADELIRLDFENETFDHPDRVYQVQPESINDFKNQLNRGVSCFWGNDSGPSHLAANMGIPTNVCYRVTNSVIWKPTGPKVYVHEFSEDSN